MKHSGPSTSDFESVWEQYYPRLRVFVTSLVGRADLEWEDLVQDIMLKVYENLERYDPASSFTAWVYSIARNHCIDALPAGTVRYRVHLFRKGLKKGLEGESERSHE